MMSSTPSGVDCWDYQDSTNCTSAGCEWELGWCSKPGCWNYQDSKNCTNSTLHPNWDCVWRSDQYGSWCEEQNCWILNETNCTNSTYNLDCVWDNSSQYCYMKGCCMLSRSYNRTV